MAEYSSGTLIYHARDNLSDRLNLDANANVLGTQGHYPYGESWYATNTTSAWHFTNYERDVESGNDNAKFRYNVNRLGRFLTTDPVQSSSANPQGLNRYAYVINDPINHRDPKGQDITCDDIPFEVLWDIWGPIDDPIWSTCDGGVGGGGGGDCGGGDQPSCGNPEPVRPPPPPPTPECFAQLKYRPLVEGPKRLRNHFSHSFWYIQDNSGPFILTSSDADGYLNRYITSNVNVGIGGDNVLSTTWFNTGVSSSYCQQCDVMYGLALGWPNNFVPYLAFPGPNSNSFAHFLANGAGFSATAPPNARGWSYPL